MLDFLLEEFVIHGDFSRLLLQPGDLQVSGVLGRFFSTARPALRNCSRHLESRAANAQFPAKQFQVFTSQQTQDDLNLTPGGKSLFPLARVISGRPTGSLR